MLEHRSRYRSRWENLDRSNIDFSQSNSSIWLLPVLLRHGPIIITDTSYTMFITLHLFFQYSAPSVSIPEYLFQIDINNGLYLDDEDVFSKYSIFCISPVWGFQRQLAELVRK